jgi:hypothetical protein
VYVPAQTKSQPDYAALFSQKQQAFQNYEQDFVDFESDEYTPSSDLVQVAFSGLDHINSAKALLEIYDTLSCPEDRANSRCDSKGTCFL